MTRNATATPIHPLLAERWSPRGYTAERDISDEEISSLLEAARWSPSAMNNQPWGFIVTRRGTDDSERVFETLIGFNQAWTATVGSLIVAYVNPTAYGDHPEGAYYDLGQAVAHLTLQAKALGLDAHQMSGFDHARLAAAFDVPEGYRPATVIAVGEHVDDATVPEQIRERDRAPRERRSIEELLLRPIA